MAVEKGDTGLSLIHILDNVGDDGVEVTVEFFRCFFHAVSDPPLNHFDKVAGNVVDKEAFRNLSAKLVVFQQVGFCLLYTSRCV